MRFSAVAFLGLAAIAYAQEPDAVVPGGEVTADPTVEGGDAEVDTTDPNTLYKEPFGFPPGVDKPKNKDLPKFGPPGDKSFGKDKLPVWHPPHKGVFIDDCDDDKDDKWHWAHKGGKHPKPMIPHHKWTTSTVTATKTKTVIDCPDHVPHCPGDKGKTKFTTTTVEVTTTICPVPITDKPAPPPHPPKPTPPGPPPPGPPKPAAPPSGPPAPTGAPVVPNVPSVSKPPVIVSAGAAQNAAGALAVVAALVAALI